MNVPDKVAFRHGEKLAEIIGGSLLAAFAAVIIAFMALGITDGKNIIMLLVMLIEYGIFSICSVYPQGTNIITKPELATDDNFHKVRRDCIAAKLVLSVVLFLLAMPFAVWS